MNFSLRATIRACVAPEHRLSCSRVLWRRLLRELARRGDGRRESGAFLLGEQREDRRCIVRFVPYDDLDPRCLDSGVVVFDGAGYGPLWELCRNTGLEVVADIHSHPGAPWQSGADRVHPMIALPGHVALIVPNLAQRIVAPEELGIYEYGGGHRWQDRSGQRAGRFFYVGIWG